MSLCYIIHSFTRVRELTIRHAPSNTLPMARGSRLMIWVYGYLNKNIFFIFFRFFQIFSYFLYFFIFFIFFHIFYIFHIFLVFCHIFSYFFVFWHIFRIFSYFFLIFLNFAYQTSSISCVATSRYLIWPIRIGHFGHK